MTNDRITINPQICHGKPCIAGTRIMVANILSLLAGGYTIARILEYYPDIEHEDVVAAIEYARAVVENEEIYPLFVPSTSILAGVAA